MSRSSPPKPLASKTAGLPRAKLLPDPVTPPTRQIEAIVEQDEAALDEALAQTFPASDPVRELPASAHTEKDLADDMLEHALDAAVAMTFPASDPIAISIKRSTSKT